MKKKYLALSELIGKPETTSLYISLQDFEALIENSIASGATGLRMYFANYCHTGVASVDQVAALGYENMLALIFAPTDSGNNDLGYYLVNPAGGLITFPKQIALIMISAYRSVKIPVLQAIISECGNNSFQETKTMWLAIDKFHGNCGFVREAKCQDATGIRIYIGCYPPNYKLPGTTFDVSWQFTVIFEFVKTIRFLGTTPYTYIFDLEDTEGWGGRKQCNSGGTEQGPPETTLGLEMIAGGNTICPCPPSTTCCGGL